MDTTRQDPAADEGFDPHRIRSIQDVTRSREDRMVAGVCAGLARHLNIDPVVVRIVVAALTLVGFAGVILYLAAWLLLPAEGASRSVAGKWFNLGATSEAQVRVAGLIIAALIAVTSGIGVLGNQWDASFPWFALLVLAGFYVLAIRPYQNRRQARGPATDPPDGLITSAGSDPGAGPAYPERAGGGTLTLITLSTVLIGLGALWLYANEQGELPWTAYGFLALAIIGVALVVASWIGSDGPLIFLGATLAIGLAIASVLPSSGIGQRSYTPQTIGDVRSSYELGMGELVLDLDELPRSSALSGRTIRIDVGIGATRVVVPDGLPVDVEATTTAGEVRVFDRTMGGTQAEVDFVDPDNSRPALRLEIDGGLGEIEVQRS